MNYYDFLKQKQHSTQEQGIKPITMPSCAYDFQQEIISRALYRGRCALFIDTGLGKTLMQLAIADNIVKSTNKSVLIITPLAVAFQFVLEADKIGIDDVEYSKDGKFTKKIVVCNYERLHYFNSNDFEAVILDESSILKNFEGAIKNNITSFVKKVNYRFLASATPSPNDYIELGTSSEALGFMGYTDMLGRFFKNNQNNVVKSSRAAMANIGAEWYLRPHAENSFWQWVNTWSIAVRKPSDLGFSDERYKLPPLNENIHVVNNLKPLEINGQHELFNIPAQKFSEIKAEVRATLQNRCEKAVELAKNKDISVFWVNLNDEASTIKDLCKDAKEIKGSMSLDEKEDLLLAFSHGQIKKLITKTSITAFGLNWQHCNHSTYFPTYSYEQYYQAIRRFYRFGQEKSVTIDIVSSDGQKKIMEALMIKKEKAIAMFEKLTTNTNASFSLNIKEFDKDIQQPLFLRG